MRTILVLIACVLMCDSGVLAQTSTDQCLTCHRDLEDDASKGFVRDIHYTKGLTCASCHGGDPSTEDMEVAMSPENGFKGKPTGDEISGTCKTCHADAERMSTYGSSLPTEQGQSLLESIHGVPSVAGEGHAIQCIDCHGVHGIQGPKNRRSPVHPLNVVRTCTKCHSNTAYMRQYNPSIPTDQLSEYRTSVHGKRHAAGDANAATCVNCHGSHDVRAPEDIKSKVFPANLPGTCATCHANETLMKKYGIEASQYSDYASSVHGVALLEKRDLSAPACNDCHGNHGAAPPGIASISNVCGTCHVLNADLFANSPHKAAFASLGVPQCETCHGNHNIIAATNKLIGTSSEAVCSTCHNADDNPRGFAVAGVMRGLIDSLETIEQEARALVDEAEQKGMEISEAKFKLREIRQARLQSRTAIHSFDQEKFDPILKTGMETGEVVKGEAQDAIEEFGFRRSGFGIATLIITFLAITFYISIRRLERRQASQKGKL